MRTFADIRHELGLEKFLASPLGTLYITPDVPGQQDVIVRHFDSELPSALAPAYAEVMRAAQRWVEARPELERQIRVEQPIEVGSDFVARPHHVYVTSTRAYAEWEDPPTPPRELATMRATLTAALQEPANERDRIVGEVLARSLLQPTGKTYFHEGEGRFIVVEPGITRRDVERWASGGPGSRGEDQEGLAGPGNTR